MRLVQLDVVNFRCLAQVSIPFDSLTVLIGENDAGKSSVLDLLEIALNEGRPDDNDYFCPLGGSSSQMIEVTLTFHADPEAEPEAVPYVATDGRLHLRKQFTQSGAQAWYRGSTFDDVRLSQDFAKMSVADIDSCLSQLGIAVEGRLNKDQKLQLISTHKERAAKHEDWIEIAPAKLKEILPRFERYRSIDYQSPETLVMKTLRQVYESIIFEPSAEGGRVPIESLRALKTRVDDNLNAKVGGLLAFVRRYNPSIRKISFDATVDFTGGLRSGQFLVDDGRGPHYLSKSGDGTKRRLATAAIDWDREVLTQQAQTGRLRPTLRGYDEPDVNLHYRAQRMMYNAILDIVTQPNSSVQAVICTHSMTMIDQAPAPSIRLLQMSETGSTDVALLRVDDDKDIEDFLTSLARELGITNALLFYERCYVIVEGPTEENALPILYRRKHSRSMLEDGIRLINIEGNGGRVGLLKLLGKNRQAMTLAMLDKDSKTGDEFAAAGFATPVIEQQITYIGRREFEDAFDDDAICLCLNNVWPRVDSSAWTPDHLAKLREDQTGDNKRKFSDGLMNLIRTNCQCGPENRKPIYGKMLAEICPLNSIPPEIGQIFQQARKIAGCE